MSKPIGQLIENMLNDDKTTVVDEASGTANEIDNLVDTKLEGVEKRTDFAEPDRNEVDDVPDENPKATLKDIEKEVTESYLAFAKAISDEDITSASKQLVEIIEISSNTTISPGERERMTTKITKTIASESKAVAAGIAVGAAAGLAARVAILRRKCKKAYSNDPEKLKTCLAKANRTKTASNKTYGFK